MKKVALFTMTVLFVHSAKAQLQAPTNLFQVLGYSATLPSGTMPSIYQYNGSEASPKGAGANLYVASNFKGVPSILQLSGALNSSIATALSVIPLASPASGVVYRTDPATGGPLPVSYTLGPIFTERAETVGKHKVYIGVSNQDFHFTSFNGRSLNGFNVLDLGGQTSNILINGAQKLTYPATFQIGMGIRLSQNMAFITLGLTNRFDVSVGLPVVHAAVRAATSDGMIYVGNGLNNYTQPLGNCWCVDTFTPASNPLAAANGLGGLVLPQIGSDRLGKNGFGDVLLRFKGAVFESLSTTVAVGTDLRLPTGDAQNYLGTGTTSVRPFLAVSRYTKPLSHDIVFSPHLNVGWQFSGKSILGGQLQGTCQVVTWSGDTITNVSNVGQPGEGTCPSVTLASNQVTNFGPPFVLTKDYLPDVFSWAGGTEVALGKHNTIVVDVLGNQIGWIHGIQNMNFQSVPQQVPAPSTSSTPVLQLPSGFVNAGRVAFGEYSGAFGYKVRIARNLVATFNMLVRFDNNDLTARAVPLYGLSYTFGESR